MESDYGGEWTAEVEVMGVQGEPDYAPFGALPPPSAVAAASMLTATTPPPAVPAAPPALTTGSAAGVRRQDMPPDQRYGPPVHTPPPQGRGSLGMDTPTSELQRVSAPVSAPVVQDGGGHMLGFAMLAVGLGTVLGVKYGGGVYGGAAGGLAGGSLVNGVRAVRMAVHGNAQSDREAIVSGTYTVLGFGLAGYLLYKAREGHKKAA